MYPILPLMSMKRGKITLPILHNCIEDMFIEKGIQCEIADMLKSYYRERELLKLVAHVSDKSTKVEPKLPRRWPTPSLYALRLNSKYSILFYWIMKSAYELAMERLEAEDPNGVTKITSEQKKQLAEIDIKYKAKVAEREVFLEKTLNDERLAGNMEEAEKVAAQLRSEKSILEEEKEVEKNKIRNAK